MPRPQPITTRIGPRPGELVISLPPGWELRLRRVLRTILADLPADPHRGPVTPQRREAQARARRKRMQAAICQFVSDLVTADIVGKEVALATRTRYGTRGGSLREHVAAILREVNDGKG